MSETESVKPRIPVAVNGIQVNFCKNPSCTNFGTPASTERTPRGIGARDKTSDKYTVTGTSDGLSIQCHVCRECPPIKSNAGINDELSRFLAPIFPQDNFACPKKECENNYKPVTKHPKLYSKFGKSKTGSPRFQCKVCNSVFNKIVKTSSISQHKRSEKNAAVFLDLVNKTPLKAIARKHKLSMKTVYDKIDFIHRQCVTFASAREREYLPNLQRNWMEIAVDRQEHTINWERASDRRNIRLYAVGSADTKSGYVFGLHVNYDPTHNIEDIEADAKACGDYDVQRPFRKHARFWLLRDYLESVTKSTTFKKARAKKAKSAEELVERTYDEAAQRTDIEAFDEMGVFDKLPKKGMQVHAEYTLYAHFYFLRKLLQEVEYFRFYLDQDSGMRAACLAAFNERILCQECDAFYVKVGKEFTQAEKASRVSKWKWARDEFVATNPYYVEASDFSIRRTIIEQRLNELKAIGKWKDRWLDHPFVTMSEPEKMVCYLTNLKEEEFDQDDQRMALMYDRASLHVIDSFFMQVRRLISLFERPLGASSTGGRKWYGYSAYRPDVAVKVLEIFRVYHNYVQLSEGRMRRRLKPGEKKRKPGELKKLLRTPAWRLGLAKGEVSIEDILYFMPKAT